MLQGYSPWDYFVRNCEILREFLCLTRGVAF